MTPAPPLSPIATAPVCVALSGGMDSMALLHALAQRNLKRGLAAACLGGGNAVAMIVERGA